MCFGSAPESGGSLHTGSAETLFVCLAAVCVRGTGRERGQCQPDVPAHPAAEDSEELDEGNGHTHILGMGQILGYLFRMKFR